MALRVDDAGRAIQRARALLCQEWQERVGAGERHIPAVRAPDGMLVYLVQPDASGRSIWEDDFVLHPPEAGQEDAGLVGIDHLAAGAAGRAHGQFRPVLPRGVRS